MKSDTFMKLSFGLLVCVNAYFMIMAFQVPGVSNQTSFILTYFASIPFMVTAIVELNESDRIDKKEKTMWTFYFVAAPLLAGILYFLTERKRVLSN